MLIFLLSQSNEIFYNVLFLQFLLDLKSFIIISLKNVCFHTYLSLTRQITKTGNVAYHRLKEAKFFLSETKNFRPPVSVLVEKK